MSGFPLRRDKFLSACSRDEYARRNSWSLFPRRGSLTTAHQLCIPPGMIAPGKFQGHVAVNYGVKSATLREHAHVNMNHEICNREQRRHRMQKHAKIP